ncbi:MAG TPA: response regulator [Gemmataceae bacterium]|nr:response regulator [Gemmataceae bacterium]
MLVLSRRPGQRILFPHLNIAVQVLPGRGSVVRLGIEAPPHVAVLREELAPAEMPPAEIAPPAPEMDRKQRHDLRGQLNTLAMALHVAEMQLQAGRTADAEHTIQQAQAILEKAAPKEPPPAPAAPRRPIEALLVEDNPNEEALLSSYLRLNGFHVETAHDGYEALEFLGHERPDFVLLDMRLPRFDGPSTVAAIRQNPAYRGLRIFAVTGSPPEEFNLSTGEGGVDAWFQKPLNPKRIVEAMSAATAKN